MPKRIEKLTPEQEARMASFAQEWIERGWRTGPLTEEEWAVWEDGARRCYEFAGIPWPGVVVRVASPLVGAFAAPAAALALELVKDQSDDAVRGAVDDAVDDAVRGAVDDAVHDAVRDAVGDAVDDAVRGAVGGAVRGAVHGAVDVAVHGAVDVAVRGAVDDAVDVAVDVAVRGAVDGAVHGAVDDAVHDAVRDAVGGAVGGAVRGAVHGAVDDAVDVAVRGAVRDRAVMDVVSKLWHYRLGGRWWAGWWQAYSAYFRDVAGLTFDNDTWGRSRAYEDASSAGWWWPFKGFVMVSDVPTVMHLERVGPTGWGSHRLHCDDGPAIAWSNGDSLNYWHGLHVPDDFFDWDVKQAMKHPNAEIRRAGIEMVGWENFLEHLTLVATAADPGNEPHEISLYDLPADMQLYDERARILVVHNASLDKGGHRRVFGLPVEAHQSDPIAAAASLFGIPVEAYRQTVRAS